MIDKVDENISAKAEKIETKVDKLQEAVPDIDKRLFSVEHMMHMNERGMIHGTMKKG